MLRLLACLSCIIALISGSRSLDAQEEPTQRDGLLPVSGAARNEPAIKQEFVGGGRWRTAAGGEAPGRGWRIDAVQDNEGAVKAKLSVLGVPGFEDVTIEAQMIEGEAFGVLLDQKGTQVATFNAKLSTDRSGGTFVLGNGESGIWEYDARTKAELDKAATVDAPAAE